MDDFFSPNLRLKTLEFVDRDRVSAEPSTPSNGFYTVPELYEILRALGIYDAGTKSELVNILLDELDKYEYQHRLYRN